jgi:hypothetical protein
MYGEAHLNARAELMTGLTAALSHELNTSRESAGMSDSPLPSYEVCHFAGYLPASRTQERRAVNSNAQATFDGIVPCVTALCS